MGIVARWFGDGLTDGALVDNTTAGTGDDPLDTVTGGTFTIDASGGRPPRLQMDQVAATAAQLIWTSATLGTLTGHAVRAYLEVSALPSAGTPILQAYGTGNTALRWRLDITSAGLVRLRDAANAIVATSGVALTPGTLYRVEPVVDAAGAAAVTVYAGEATAALITLSGAVGAGADAVRFGNTNTSPTWPTTYFDDLAVADAAAQIGPRRRTASGAWAIESTAEMTAWARRRPGAAFTADLGWTATPRVRRRASAAWAITSDLNIDTGTPPLSALADGEWRPATIREMTAGSWQPT